MPTELFRRFEEATGVEVIEGYGLTEATCLVSCNPPLGSKRIGSVGYQFPYTDVKIVKESNGKLKECAVDEAGEVCISNPGVFDGNTYTDQDKNKDLYYKKKYLRTGDLGRVDADEFLWITGRAKDLIIRGGRNIDPAIIEEALLGHDAVAFAGAIGQPDAHSGELPCTYVELVEGADISEAALLEFANNNISEPGAKPKYLEVLDELPKTAVGKVFKPDLRKRAITRVYNETFEGSTLYAPYVDNTINTISWPGDSLKVLMNQPITGDLYNGDTSSSDYNPLGWYSWKVVVKQTEQDYYNVYLPGIMSSYPSDQTLEVGQTSHTVLINDNINKIPRDLNEVGPDQRQFGSSVQLFGRVENTNAAPVTGGGNLNVQYYSGKNSDTVSVISTVYDMFDFDPLNPEAPNFFPQFYSLDSNPLVARITTESLIGQLSTTQYFTESGKALKAESLYGEQTGGSSPPVSYTHLTLPTTPYV